MIELLEARVAPASVLTFTDVDGDKVKITSSSGDLSGKATFVTLGAGQQLQVLDLTDPSFQGASITTSVTKGPNGDGLVNIGFINASGRDLANVSIKGDLGQIEVGDINTATTGLKLLSVRSIGRFGLSTQGGAGDLESVVMGALGTLQVSGDFADATLNVTGGMTPGDGKIGRISIGGSLIGSSRGVILASGDIGAVKIGRDLIGGSADGSGRISSGGKITSLSIGGSVVGGAGILSGEVDNRDDMGPVKIGRDLVGGDGLGSGQISTTGSLASLTIGGSVRGGFGDASGTIFGSFSIGPVKIGGDVAGGDGENSGGIFPGFFGKSISIGGSLSGGAGGFSGRIVSDGNIGPIKIGRDLQGGTGERSGRIEASEVGAVTIGRSVVGGPAALTGDITSYSGDLGPVKIGRDLLGGAGAESGKIDAGGRLLGLTIGGSVIGGSGPQDTFVDNNNVRHEGQIFSVGNMGQVKIGRNLEGGPGSSSGQIHTAARLAGVSVSGSLTHGSVIFSEAQMGGVTIRGDVVESGIVSRGSSASTLSSVTIGGSVIDGQILSDAGTGSIKIGGDLLGTRVQSGLIASGGNLVSVTIGGSLIGGKASLSGAITSDGDIGPVKIGGDIRGGSLDEGEELFVYSGYIQGNRIASVFVGGSIITGIDNSTTESLVKNGSIRVENDIGAITIKGSLIGNSGTGGTTPVIISARGQETLAPNARSDIAIKSLTVGGRVEWAEILGGFAPDDTVTAGSNGNASIGAVKVGGDWIASSISAGIQDGGLPGFGTAGDTVINNATDAIIARIASITIQGTVSGIPQPVPFTHFGFTAQQIGSFRSLGFVAQLTAGTDAPIELSPTTGDVTIREI